MEIFKPELHSFPLRAFLDEARDGIGSTGLEEILGEYGLDSAALKDSSAWVSVEFVGSLLERLNQRVGAADFIDRAIARGMTPKYLGALFPLLFAFGSPRFTYDQVCKSAGRFNKVGRWNSEAIADGLALGYSLHPNAAAEGTPIVCQTRLHQLRRVPTLFALPLATVEHPKCMNRGDACCEYVVHWQERRVDNYPVFGALVGVTAAMLAWLLMRVSWSGSSTLMLVGFGLMGWASGLALRLRRELASRTEDINEHNRALDRVTRANEQRYAELLEAKAAVDSEVEQRTGELRLALQRLSETLKQIQSLDAAKTDFFNNVSHELRSPLTLILAPLDDLIAGRMPAGGSAAAFQAMHRNAGRLLRLINQLLDLAKVDAGQVTIAPVATDLEAFARTVLSNFEAAANKKGLSLTLRTSPSLSPIAIDPAWIESALTNLLANAVRLTPAGKEVRVLLNDSGADVLIAVSDDGPGIPTQDHEKVFERFAQGDSGKRVVGGTGIGLALVREAARLHGGEVKLVSEVGKGTTFTLRIPRRADVAVSARPKSWKPTAIIVDDATPASSESSQRSGPMPTAPLAFVVEDNAELREFISDVLSASYRVHSFADGRAAVPLARKLKPDVVVSDVAMPEMNGFELCRALRSHESTRGIPLLLVTARTDMTSVLEGFDAGANDYVLKPFHGRELLARVDVHVRLRRMVQELALRERHAMLGVLSASVAHQVRNPLTTLVSGLPAMRVRMQDTASKSTLELIDVMMDCSGRIERLTRDLMELSRIDRETSGPFRPSDGLSSAIRFVESRGLHGVTIDERVEESPAIDGKAGDLNHVFMNILDNAVRAVEPEGRIRIEASTQGRAYVIAIGDSGPGISEEEAAKVFEPFYTTRPAGEGTGLGLAIALQVMRQCGGNISLGRSSLGGAEFVIDVPLQRASSTPVPSEDVVSSPT